MKNTDRISVTTPKAVDPVQDPMPKGIRRVPGSTMKDGDPIPVAIYARVSSDRQDIHNSIEAQIEECTRYAKANNMVIVAIYTDEAASGRISSRTGFQEMVADGTSRDAKFHTILVWKLSRFSRNLFDSVTYQAILEQRGVELISITEPIDDSPAGRMIRAMIQTINAFSSDTLGEDVRRGLRKLVQRGFYPHYPVSYGLKLVKTKEKDDEPAHYIIVLDPPHSDVVRRLFLEAIAGRTDKDIREGLHDDGIPSPNGKEWWPPSTIDAFLNKVTYEGYAEWGVSSKSGDEPLVIPGHHEGIVTPEEFEMARQSRAARAKSQTHPREAGSDRMMGGLMKCVKCGENLQVRPRSDHSCDYVCKTRRHDTVSECDCPNVHSTEFEPLFLKTVTDDILSPGNTTTTIEIVSRELAVPYEEQISRLELITKEILGLEKKEDRVMTAYEAGAYTVENFTKRMDPLRKQKAELEEKKAEAKRDLDRDAAIVADPQLVIDFARDMSKLIRNSQPKETKELLKRFVKCVWIEPGRATIVYRIPLPSDGPNPGATKRELALPGGEPVSVRPTAHGGPPHHVGGHPQFPGGHVPHRGQQALHARHFLKVARRPGGHRLDHRVLLGGGRQHDHPGRRRKLHYLPARLHPVLVRHQHVHHDNVQRQLRGGPHCFLTIPGLPHHLELPGPFQHQPQAVPHDRVVVNQQHPYGVGLRLHPIPPLG